MDEAAGDARDAYTERARGWRLALPPAVFLAHFALVYGLTALLCRFGGAQRAWAGIGWVTIVVLLVTALAVAVLAWGQPRAPHEFNGDRTDPYDPSARRHFVATAARMTTWLAMGGVVLVALPALFARTCGVHL